MIQLKKEFRRIISSHGEDKLKRDETKELGDYFSSLSKK